MIPGVGRYSMLITPRAGSLFHAVFHTTVRPSWAQETGHDSKAPRSTRVAALRARDPLRSCRLICWEGRLACSSLMKPVSFRYFAPRTVDDALDLLATHGEEGKILSNQRDAWQAMSACQKAHST
jgi:hypothetical protein